MRLFINYIVAQLRLLANDKYCIICPILTIKGKCLMAKNSELKPIFNMSTKEYNQPGALLKFLMTRAKMSRAQLLSKLETQHSIIIASPTQISDFISDKTDRTIPFRYLAQLIKCFGMKKKEEKYYIQEFLRACLPDELAEYVNAPGTLLADISKNMAMANMNKNYKKLQIDHGEQAKSLDRLKSDLAGWRKQVFELIDALDFIGFGPTREPRQLTEIETTKIYKVVNEALSYKAALRFWERQGYGDPRHHLDIEYEAIKEGERYDDYIKNSSVEKYLVAELLENSTYEIVKDASNQSIQNMINSFFNQSLQSEGLMKSWYTSSIKWQTNTKTIYVINDAYLNKKGFLRPLCAIICSIYTEWFSALDINRNDDLSIEGDFFQEYCCNLFSSYKKYFPALSSWLAPFDAADPKAAYDLLMNHYLDQRVLYDGNFGATLKPFEEFMLERHPECTYFNMPVCTALAFGSFAVNSEVLTHGPIIKKIRNDKIEFELDHSQQSFSFGWLYSKREHDHIAPDAGIHLAKLMDGQFNIEQAKEVSVSILNELSTSPAKESYIAFLNRALSTALDFDQSFLEALSELEDSKSHPIK